MSKVDERNRLHNEVLRMQHVIDTCKMRQCESCRNARGVIAELNAQIEALDHYDNQTPINRSLDIDLDYLIKKAKRHAATLDSERCEELLFKITQAKAAFAEAVADAMEVAQ